MTLTEKVVDVVIAYSSGQVVTNATYDEESGLLLNHDDLMGMSAEELENGIEYGRRYSWSHKATIRPWDGVSCWLEVRKADDKDPLSQ